MSRTPDRTPHPDLRPPELKGQPAVTPPPDIALSLEEIPPESDKTEEWALPLGPEPVVSSVPLGHLEHLPGAVNGASADVVGPEPAAAVGAPFGETPTAPLPVDPSESPPESSDVTSAPAGDARAEDAAEVVEEELEIVDAGPPVAPEPSPARAAAVAAMPTPPPPVPASAGAGARPAGMPPVPPGPLQPTEAWAEPLAQRPRKKRLKPWFEEVFDEDYLRTLPFMTAEQTLREVNFIRDGLAPPGEAELLDVGCGYGRHAIELAQRGFRVTGIDLSLPLLIRAADESQRRGLSVNFVHADMRELSFEDRFDGAYCMLTTFGYFDEETNSRVAAGIFRSLKPGGRFLVDAINRDYIVADLPTRVWWEGEGCLVLEEVDFNYHTSRMAIRRSVVFQDGRQLEHDISIRAYSLHELGRVLRGVGFRVIDVSGSLATKSHFFGATSRNILMVCEKPAG